MGINLKKIFSVGLAVALAATMSVGFADDDGDDDEGYRNKHRVVKALEPSVDRQENIVISLATDPVEGDTEPACVALQIGMNLLMDEVTVEGVPVEVIPADGVTLFLTVDGVELVYELNDFSAPDCLTPYDPPNDYKSLDELLTGFVNLGGEIKICPLCWKARGYGGTPPTHDATVADAVVIHELFLYADKVITF